MFKVDKKYFLVFILFLNILSGIHCQNNWNHVFKVTVREEVYSGHNAIDSVKIDLFKNDLFINTIYTGKNGFSTFNLEKNASYSFKFNKAGYIEKRINFDTHLDKKEELLTPTSLTIALHKIDPNNKTSFFDKYTVGTYSYNEAQGKFTIDFSHFDSYFDKLSIEDKLKTIQTQDQQIFNLEKIKLEKEKKIALAEKDKKLKIIELEKSKLILDQKEQEKKLNLISINQKNASISKLKNDKKNKELYIKNKNKIINQQKTITISILIGSIFLLILLIFSIIAFIQKKKQKLIIENSHTVLEHKNREILDSITYAKRIQSAILPQPRLVKEYFKDSFILYKPKDIVAGDFYWFEVIDDLIFFAAADCTGHGVPGAIVSVVCHNALNRSVKEFNLKNPADILDKTREIVVSEFEKSDEDVKDGMDISLCAINLKSNSLNWSGAHNPLWILRNKKIIEYKADKQPIGKFAHSKAFTSHEITLQKDDEIYIFTDGFQDQFGGAKQKKYKVSQMRELIIGLNQNTMEEKRTQIDLSFESWRGNLEQVDDVCVIGVRV